MIVLSIGIPLVILTLVVPALSPRPPACSRLRAGNPVTAGT